MDALVASYNQVPLQERKVYIACMHLSQIRITVSFLPAELQRHHSLTPDDITGAASRCAAAVLRVLLPHAASSRCPHLLRRRRWLKVETDSFRAQRGPAALQPKR